MAEKETQVDALDRRHDAIMNEVHDTFEESVSREPEYGEVASVDDGAEDDDKTEETETGESEGEKQPDPKDKAKQEGLVKPGDPKRFAKRIGQVVFQREELRRRNTELEAELERMKSGQRQEEGAQPPEEQPAKTTDKSQRPKSEDYETYEEYVEALTDWKTDQAVSAKLAELETKQKTTREEEALTDDFMVRVSEAEQKYPDFSAVAFAEGIPYDKSPVLAEAVATSEHFADVAYYLGKNPEKAAEIAAMNPVDIVRAIDRIEATFSGEKSEPPPKPQPTKNKITKAPAPIKPIENGSGTGKKAYEDMSDEEYMRTRDAEERAELGY